MDFNLKQWRRDESQEEEEENSAAKQPRLVPAPALPFFVPNTNSSTSSATKFPKMGSCYFSLAQWQELEVQALIFRHIIAGAAVPIHLLHLVNINKSSNYPLYPLLHYPQSHLVQSGYWGKGAMDPEPGRCRRTDGKKWRCSRDVVAAQKYCERHMHRGRNRSRKPVESTASTPFITSMDLHPRPPLDSINETKSTFESQNDGGRTLRRFFDDWPRSLHDTDNNVTNLSISTPGGSDFSLKLGTGNVDECKTSGGRERPQPNWGMAWENNRAAPMGGPLAEALRSSIATSSPTSVLHRLARSSASENSYVTF